MGVYTLHRTGIPFFIPIRRIPGFSEKVSTMSTKSTNTFNPYIAMLSDVDIGHLQRIYKIYNCGQGHFMKG
jgi:hypothetical protein